ncbi:hypothetical protein ZIOFF_068874 [Zingiber officinale]|uniref:Peptidase C14 caspase domain-containing protein n=1 Tax=Zingiber officinale TaxID=94328 RepID=A0A8J5C346_ZINOF|nr:hypothetical protein ZIOFF_068874 [Zingiber officinale]
MSMCRRRKETVRCSGCGRLLEVPPHVQSICCAVCLAVTGIRDYQDPAGQAMGFLRSVVSNFSNGTGGSNSYSDYYGRPTAGQMPSSFPGVHGKKRALLVGISYAGQRCELKGTVNDVNCIRYLLTEKFGYPAPCIVVLTGEEIELHQRPAADPDKGEPEGGDAVAGAGMQGGGLAGVPLLRPRGAEAGPERRRGGRVRRGVLPGGLQVEGHLHGRRGQIDARLPAARCPAAPRRQAARPRRRLPQRHHPRPPLPLSLLQEPQLSSSEMFHVYRKPFLL